MLKYLCQSSLCEAQQCVVAAASLKAHAVKATWRWFWGAATRGGARGSSAFPTSVWGAAEAAGVGGCAPAHAAGECGGMEQTAKGEMGKG